VTPVSTWIRVASGVGAPARRARAGSPAAAPFRHRLVTRRQSRRPPPRRRRPSLPADPRGLVLTQPTRPALALAGPACRTLAGINLSASSGIAIREFKLAEGFGFADYLQLEQLVETFDRLRPTRSPGDLARRGRRTTARREGARLSPPPTSAPQKTRANRGGIAAASRAIAARTKDRMPVRRAIAVALIVVLVGPALTPSLGHGQTTIETQKGTPPAPNTAAPEYAPTPGSPPKPSTIEPPPGKPALAPGPRATDERGRIGQPQGRTFLGARLGPLMLLGVIAGALIILAVGAMRRRRGPG
jgi:hypothetical protein